MEPEDIAQLVEGFPNMPKALDSSLILNKTAWLCTCLFLAFGNWRQGGQVFKVISYLTLPQKKLSLSSEDLEFCYENFKFFFILVNIFKYDHFHVYN